MGARLPTGGFSISASDRIWASPLRSRRRRAAAEPLLLPASAVVPRPVHDDVRRAGLRRRGERFPPNGRHLVTRASASRSDLLVLAGCWRAVSRFQCHAGTSCLAASDFAWRLTNEALADQNPPGRGPLSVKQLGGTGSP